MKHSAAHPSLQVRHKSLGRRMLDHWQIYLLLMLRSVGSAFHAPAMKSSIPLLAPEKELTRIASINQTIQALCNICGPVLGAALIVSTNMSVVMLLDVAGAAIACTTLMFVSLIRKKQKLKQPIMYSGI